MDDTDEQQETSTDEGIDVQRSIIGESLDEIAAEMGTALLSGNLWFPIGITTPSSGHAIVTIVTPLDPSNDDWAHACVIVRQIVSKKLGGIRLQNRPLPCAMANAAHKTPHALTFDTLYSVSKSFDRSTGGCLLVPSTNATHISHRASHCSKMNTNGRPHRFDIFSCDLNAFNLGSPRSGSVPASRIDDLHRLPVTAGTAAGQTLA